ncbi:homolog to endonuclease VapC [Natrialba magadii ATCC 43099]|uniref:Ribonuclease VapC n=1 Tax=Natrialba magadii (strain ATCC 43099 / DSM 3394 / CCM 3739 / CIP 104546 / IAM 13178 / JCM 8861 / NBRC 102185 / NCIMB 2190 / MS3) TaxID=547559 RepID=D3T0C0_NATMM|nr:type II toxin-antitoxin system VapC family toxin [Natrialba magadii]ADD04478.1 homolog to endonuclease VapC [Natrialba magadii ATCC 43099]ELY25873.1 PilT protein domain-containing protein [Natrialba magadii ATCC 43099]
MSDYLFDASSVVELLIGERGVNVDISILFDEYLLDLTMYEAANALWKTGLAHDNLTESELEDAVTILSRLGTEVRLETVSNETLTSTMDVAQSNGLTFYDAAYLATAERTDLTLVTEDSALRTAAREQEIRVESVRTDGSL